MFLHLTTPIMKNPDVVKAQRMLADVDNRSKFGNYRPGPIDGEYGETSAAATRRAKYWIGYKKSNITGAYGDTLHNFLSGKKGLTLAMKTRRAARIRRRKLRAERTPLRVNALKLAKSQLGVNENPPNTNRVKFSEWYGMIGAWCAMFVTWSYVKAGSVEAFKQGHRWAYCPYLLADAKAGRYGLRILGWDEVREGDIVLYNFDGDSAPEHVGLFERKVDGYNFDAIEGNTSLTSQDDGGEVMRRRRSRSLVVAFVRAEA